jgi:hypothetical protein
MTSPSTITARSDSLRPQPHPFRVGAYFDALVRVRLALFAAALTGCSAHDYSFACGLIAGFPIGFCFMGWVWAVSRRAA